MASEVLELDSEVILVEDEKTAREQLTAALERKKFKVKPVASGHIAVSLVDSAEPTQPRVFLVDIEMDQGDLDGIEAARRIQVDDLYSSFIFVTGFSGHVDYRQRVEEAELRIGGWIEKPINEERLNSLVTMIEKEMGKVKMRISLSRAKARGISPIDHLGSISLWDPSVSNQSVDELLAEQRKNDDPNSRVERDFMARDAEIERLYAEIRSLAAQSASDPSHKSQIDPLKAQLRALQEEEAGEVEKRFDARLHLEPGTGWQALELAKRLAGR